MTTKTVTATSEHESKNIATTMFKLGATSYGGPAIMGFMQAELQERRRWVSKERFVEGLAVANMVPGATATQLGIFLAYARGGWWGGLLGGLCFVFPACRSAARSMALVLSSWVSSRLPSTASAKPR